MNKFVQRYFYWVKEFHLYFLINVLIYLLFFYKLLDSRYTLWSSDARFGTFPAQYYLAEKLSKFEFPFWTERAYLGFAPYQDSEVGYLNPLNILFTFLFGFLSVNFIHIFSYMLGIYSFYKIFESYKFNLLSKIIGILPFYYSFFHLNHLSHTMIIFSSLLLPVSIYLVVLFLNNKKLRYLLLQGLTLAISIMWGHPQAALLNITGLIIFSIFSFKKNYELIHYLFFSAIFTLSFSMIQVYPTISVYFQSERFTNELKYTNISNFPLLNLNLIFPYTFGYFGNFQGTEISGGLSFVETYNYLGIVTFVFLFTYLLIGYKDKNFKLVLTAVWFFIIISSIKSIPYIESLNIPVLDTLRYWLRSVYLLLFFVSFSIGYVLNNKFVFKEIRIRYVSLILIFFIFSNFLTKNEIIDNTYNFLVNNRLNYIKKIDILVWFLVLLLSICLIFIRNYYQKAIFSLLLLGMMLFDFRFFSLDFTHFRITKYSNPSLINLPEICTYNRCLLENTTYSSYEPMLTKVYNPYGYSQFITNEYLNFFKLIIGGEPRKSIRSETLRSEIDLNKLTDLGFKAIILANNDNIFYLNSHNLDFFEKDLSGDYLQKKEGAVALNVQIPENGYYETTLKYSPYWITYVNNNKTSLEKNGLFSKIYLEKGLNNIKIFYFPYDIVYGLVIGLLLFVFGYFGYTFIEKKSLRVSVSSKNV